MTQSQALDILKLGHNIYLTGAAGSGKTFLLNAYIKYLKKHEIAVGITASTGIAATHMNGMTIHSWSGIGINNKLNSKQLLQISKKSNIKKRFKNAKVLIIDEVSMLHHYRLDLINQVCQYMKKSSLAFGGLQIVLCGDFFQLPPISRFGEKEAKFAYHSNIWQEMNIKICYLQEQHRQSDSDLLAVLNSIRSNKVDDKTLNYLRKCYNHKIPTQITPTKLYTHNYDVDAINNRELNKIKSATKVYRMQARGSERLIEGLQKSCLAPEELRLKQGAIVMFVKNNYEKGYVNGTLGQIVGFDENKFPIVKTIKNETIYANPESWNIEEDGFIKASVKQIPLRLAWAITVHKSQGMSLDAAEIDLSKSFESGMGYVALSRVRTLNGLKLIGLNNVAMKINSEVLDKDKELLQESQAVNQELNELSSTVKAKRQQDYLWNIIPTKEEKRDKKEKKIRKKKGATYEITKQMINEKKDFSEIAKERGIIKGTVIGHVEKLLARGDELDLSYIKFSEEKLVKIKKAFIQSEVFSLTPVFEALKGKFSYNELKLARVLLRAKSEV